jgi:hypothetical protein
MYRFALMGEGYVLSKLQLPGNPHLDDCASAVR